MTQEESAIRPAVVLVANEREWTMRSLESVLGTHGYAVLGAVSGRQTLELARAARPDALILDAALSDIPGVEVCRELRADVEFDIATPIIFTAADGAARAGRLEAYECGAWDYCAEPIDGEALLLKLRTFVQARRETSRLRSESLLDHATGLYNLQGLARRAREIAADAQRSRTPLACVAITALIGDYSADVEEPQAAGVLLRRVAEVGRRQGRRSDVLGRLSQGELGIIAPATDAAGAEQLVARLQSAVDESEAAERSGNAAIKLRAGYCAVQDFSTSRADPEEMLLQAVTALRQIRTRRSGERVRAFEETTPTPASQPPSSPPA